MRIGAKIMLHTELDAARGQLASLTGTCWMMSLPPEGPRSAHPAGRSLRAAPRSDSWPGLVAVTFGTPSAALGPAGPLPVHWESVELGRAPTVLLSGDITAVPAPAQGQGQAGLALAGFCQLLPAAGAGSGDDQACLQALKEAARSFITTVAVAVTLACSAGRSQELPPPGPAWSWLTGQRSAA